MSKARGNSGRNDHDFGLLDWIGALILLLERVKPGPQVTARKAPVIRTKLRKRKKEIQCFSLHS
jgi:hypothetical protein